MDLAALRARVKVDQGFDVPDLTVDGLINERYSKLVADARWGMVRADLAVTVANQAAYVMPSDILVLDLVFIDDGEYARRSDDDWDGLISGRLGLDLGEGEAGVFSGYEGGYFNIYPTPDTAGLQITGRVVRAPTPLEDDDESPALPADVHGALAWGAIADLLALDDERFDSAQVYEQKFAGAVVALKRRARARAAGGTPRLQIQGRG